MLSFNFDYFIPVTIKEAIDLFQTFARQGKTTMFFSGGTELITLGRINLAYADVVIDIKEIPECKVMGESGEYLVFGSALSLTKIEEANFFPLLTKTSSEIADHTARGKITLGGNICAQIFYREAVLPFLLADAHVIIAGAEGIRVVQINDIFKEQLQLEKGEILIQVAIEKKYAEVPYLSIKRHQQWNNGYPLITVAALVVDGNIRVAISGLCSFPFRSKEVEIVLNNSQLPLSERVERSISLLPSPILDDVEGSADYRIFVLKNILMDILMEGRTE
jgi:aerobic carbon-monoxide dehydrogenase medium subunit